jgi:hypothetical protein
MNASELERLIERRDRIADDLQVLEMAKGYHYMRASRRYQQFLALIIRCEQGRKELEASQTAGT